MRYYSTKWKTSKSCIACLILLTWKEEQKWSKTFYMCVSSGTWSLNEQEFSACFPTKKKIKMTYAIFYFFFFKTEMNSWHQWLSCEHQTLVWRRTLLEKHSVIKTGCSSIPEVSSTRLTIGVTLEKWYLMMSFYVLHRKRRKAHTCIHQWESGCSFRKENPQTNIAKLDLDCYILALPIR